MTSREVPITLAIDGHTFTISRKQATQLLDVLHTALRDPGTFRAGHTFSGICITVATGQRSSGPRDARMPAAGIACMRQGGDWPSVATGVRFHRIRTVVADTRTDC